MTEFTTNHPAGSPSWIDIGVPDHRRAMEFYGPLFGWTFEEGPAEAGYYTMCRAGGKNVAAIARNQGETECWWNLYFASDDTDATMRRIVDAGGSQVMEPMDIFDQGRMALARDPSGAQFGLWQGNAHTGTQLKNVPGAMTWAELTTPDSGTARTFYAAVLERPVEDMGEPGFDYATVKLTPGGQDMVAGIYGVPGETARWTVCFAVDDADATIARAVATGGKVVHEATDSPYGRYGVITDPYGAELAVMRLP